MDYSVEQELKKIWRALRCKADCNYSGLTFNNGLTRTANNVQLGGDIIQDTILLFDPSEYYISFGDTDNANGFYYGNIVGDNNVYLGSDGANVVAFYAESGTNSYLIGTSLDDGTGFPTVDLNVLNDDSRYGFYAYDNGGKKTSNIYYALWDGVSTTDISRIEANKDEVHGRHLIDPTGVLTNYNGFHANGTYTQLEYNKAAADDQDTGTLWTLNEDGANHFQSGTIRNQFDNNGNLLFGDPITDGTWKFFLDSGNFSIQKRESGVWVTKQTWT